MAYKYNPGFLSDGDSIDSFVVRHKDLQILSDILIENANSSANRHILVVGPRGSGKTTLARRLVAEIRTNLSLSNLWYPIVLSEESYSITTSGEFWLECVFHLALQTCRPDIDAKYHELLAETDDVRVRELALGVLVSFAAEIAKRLILIVENLNMIMEDQMTDHEGWVIRHSLQNVPQIMLFATATSRFDQIQNIDKALFEQFKTHDLRPLSVPEIATLWSRYAQEKIALGKARSIQILTGGSPRLITILAEFSADHSFQNLMARVTSLIDQYTDYFKSQLDTLASSERKVFVTLLERWDPATTREISEASRIPVNNVSAYLTRLKARGAVQKIAASGIPYWQATERLFNLYYLMRRRGVPSSRVNALVKFMTVYYEQDKLFERAADLAKEVCTIDPNLRGDHYSALTQIMDRFDAESRASLLKLTPPDFAKQITSASAHRDSAPRAPGTQKRGRRPVSALEKDIFDLIERDEPIQAADLLESSSLTKKEHANLWAIAGFSLGGLRDYARAERLLENAQRLNPSGELVWYFTGLLHGARSQAREAIEAFRKSIDFGTKDANVWLHLGDAYFAEKEEENAERSYLEAIARDSKSARAWFRFAKFLLAGKDRASEAERAFRKAVELEPEDINYLGALGEFLVNNRRDYANAEELFRKAIHYAPKESKLRVSLIHVLSTSGQPVEKIESEYAAALAANMNESWQISIEFAHHLDQMHRHDKAGEVLNAATAANPKIADVWFAFAKHCAMSKSQESKAFEAFKIALDLEPNNAKFWMVFGWFLSVRVKQMQEAEDALRKAVELEPGDCNNWRSLGQHLAHANRSAEAEACFTRAIAENPKCECALDGLAKAYATHAAGLSEVKALAEDFSLRLPSSAHPHMVLAKYLLELDHDRIGAQSEMVTALKKGAELKDVLDLFIVTLSEQDTAEGISAIDEFLSFVPRNAQTLNSVAWSLFESGLRGAFIDCAVKLARASVDLSKDSWAGRHTLASVLFAGGDVESALAEIAWLGGHVDGDCLSDFIELCVPIARAGYSELLLNTLVQANSVEIFEPLVVALKLKSGTQAHVAQEVLEVATDILAQINGSEGATNSTFRGSVRASGASSRAPSNAVERSLVRIWQKCLNLLEIGVDDDFYELGGTSLQAFLIFAGIAQTLGRDLPPTTMLAASTIAKQAALLQDGVSPRNTSKLIAFRDSGSGSPLFVIHAAFGDVGYARELARHLKSDRPGFGLRPPTLDGSEPISRTIEVIAANYIAEIRKLQHKGPYFLAGYSIGGRVAFEMAQQLVRQGETVAFLGLIDTFEKSAPKNRETVAPRAARHAAELRQRTLREMASYIGMRVAKNLDYAMAVARLTALEYLPRGIGSRFVKSPLYTLRPDLYRSIHRQASRRYTSQPYAGSIALFSAKGMTALFSAKGMTEFHRTYWQSRALGGLTVTEIPAGHTAMVWPPYSALLAESFDACLDRTRP